MALGRHVDPEKLIAESLDHPVHKHMGKRYVPPLFLKTLADE
jgi:hypothetical protein